MKTIKILFVGSAAHAEVLASALPTRSWNDMLAVRFERYRPADVLICCGDDLVAGSTTDLDRVRALVDLHARGVHVVVTPSHPRNAAHLVAALPGSIPVFDRPGLVQLEVRGISMALASSPRQPGIRSQFGSWLRSTGWHDNRSAIKVLCLHALVEGTQYGDSDFIARWGDDVLCAHQLPSDAAAIFGGAMPRAQLLQHRPDGRRLAAPVIYLGQSRTRRVPVDAAELTVSTGSQGGRALRLRLGAIEGDRAPTHHRAADSDRAWPDYTAGRSQRTCSFLFSGATATVIEFPPPPLDLPSFSSRHETWRGPRH